MATIERVIRALQADDEIEDICGEAKPSVRTYRCAQLERPLFTGLESEQAVAEKKKSSAVHEC